MNKTKLLTIAVVGLLIINLGVLALFFFTKPSALPEKMPFSEQQGPKKIIIEKLHLNRVQVQEYEVLIKTHQEKIKTLNDSIKSYKNELYATLVNDTSSIKDALISKIAVLQQKIEQTHYDHFIEIRAICKPEQYKYFNELTEELSSFFGSNRQAPPPPRN